MAPKGLSVVLSVDAGRSGHWQDELGRRMSPVLLALSEWEPGMVEHRGGGRYRVNSYVDVIRGEQTIRRILYTCEAVGLSLQTRP